ncbi:MAG: hypothetical protein M1832_000864 [Thelocarpon impressellum]|nr:MAG: hypothetical protein M1832_000864 [Thelocarpon impressellum]
MATPNLRRKDTTKGPPLRILSLDGGGVRGYSMLILIQELMYRTYVEIEGKAPKRHEIPKPCEHFDLIAGTGTGGLIAIMLGRLRLDIETCKDVYVRMTRRVFETDKTIAGIPYRSTLFKASRLEWAIQECVREHTVAESEGNDGSDAFGRSPPPPSSPPGSIYSGQGSHRPPSRISTISGMTEPSGRASLQPSPLRWGSPNALLYDSRENRTKTAVTAVYQGTAKNGAPALLRSYDSRKEPPPENNCTIWQAGRATCATGLAFKPIQIGQSVFVDEGAGKYNPAPLVLDEAAVNEWPGREVGVFVSVGTGKRPGGTNHQQSLWWEGFVGSAMGDFAEARRRLIAKIEGCEDTHQYMLKEHLSKRGTNAENYYRLNVEVGVGEFGMNEWHRLAEISTSTRRYLTKSEVQRINVDAATKLAKVHRARLRQLAYITARPQQLQSEQSYDRRDFAHPLAVELPGPDVPPLPPRLRPGPQNPPPPAQTQIPSPQDKFSIISSDEYPQPVVSSSPPPRPSGELPSYRPSFEYGPPPRSSNGSFIPSPRISSETERPSPPPLPPKTPLLFPTEPPQRNPARPPVPNGHGHGHVHGHPAVPSGPLPYPDTDGPPPMVNRARKPEYNAGG